MHRTHAQWHNGRRESSSSSHHHRHVIVFGLIYSWTDALDLFYDWIVTEKCSTDKLMHQPRVESNVSQDKHDTSTQWTMRTIDACVCIGFNVFKFTQHTQTTHIVDHRKGEFAMHFILYDMSMSMLMVKVPLNVFLFRLVSFPSWRSNRRKLHNFNFFCSLAVFIVSQSVSQFVLFVLRIESDRRNAGMTKRTTVANISSESPSGRDRLVVYSWIIRTTTNFHDTDDIV